LSAVTNSLMVPRFAKSILDDLRTAGLRPTRQRIALARLLFSQGNRHVTAESLYQEAMATGSTVSLATVYNALHDFTNKGLLHEITIDPTRSYFDTNTTEHHHFYFEKSGRLEDIDLKQIKIETIPEAPSGATIARVDIIIRVDN